MVLKREVVERRLAELDEILEQLATYRGATGETLRKDLGLRWSVERGLIAAAGVVFDVADHVLSGHFGKHAEGYEASLEGVHDRKVISDGLYERIRGLGGFRNVLIHRYASIDPALVAEHLEDAFEVFPGFAGEVLEWMDSVEERGSSSR